VTPTQRKLCVGCGLLMLAELAGFSALHFYAWSSGELPFRLELEFVYVLAIAVMPVGLFTIVLGRQVADGWSDEQRARASRRVAPAWARLGRNLILIYGVLNLGLLWWSTGETNAEVVRFRIDTVFGMALTAAFATSTYTLLLRSGPVE
jgi:hypothetical protein